MAKAAPSTWVDALARLRPRGVGAAVPAPAPVRARTSAPTPLGTPTPRSARPVVDPVAACALTGAKRAKKKCCRSTPRCRGCPVVLLRATRAAESGLRGKDLARAVKRARAA